MRERPRDERRGSSSFRARLAGRFAALMALLFLLAAGGTVWLARRTLIDQLDATLLRLGGIEAASLADAPADAMHFHEGLFDPVAGGADELVPLARYAEIWTTDGRPVLRSRSLGARDLPLAPGALAAAARNRVVVSDVTWSETAFRTAYVPLARVGSGHERHVLQVAASLAPVTDTLRVITWALAALGATATALTLVGGRALAGRAIRPALEVAEQAAAITAGSLGARLRVHASVAEYDRLVAVLNDLLGRLESAFAAQRRFVADASHEIRHPLSALRAGLELALRRERTAAEYRSALAAGIVEADRIAALTEGLLLLARSDAGVLRPRCVPTDVGALAVAAAERGAAIGAGRDVRVVVDLDGPGDPVAVVDPTLLSRALDNLVDNAVRESPPGATVRVNVTCGGETLAIAVHDEGPGVAPHHRPQLFERFFRADPVRGASEGVAGGAGLGLSIVKGIAEAHGGEVVFEPATLDGVTEVGAVFTLRLPAVCTSVDC